MTSIVFAAAGRLDRGAADDGCADGYEYAEFAAAGEGLGLAVSGDVVTDGSGTRPASWVRIGR